MIGQGYEDVLLVLIVAITTLLALVVVASGVVFHLHLRNERRATRYAAMEAEWEPALLDALYGGAHEFPVSRIHRRDRMQFLWFLVRYARRLRGDERLVLQELASPWLPELEVRSRSRRVDVRARAVQTLATLGMPRYAATVIAALDDPAPHVAMTAARALAQREHAAYAAEVLSRIDRFRHWHTRFLAAMLASIGEAGAPALRATLADESVSAQGRAVAAEALTLLKDLEAADLAGAIVRQATDTELLTAALALLGEVGHEAHLHDVTALLSNSPSAPVRARALQTVGCLGSPREVPILVASLDDESPWVALRAAYGLAEIGAVDELRRLRDEPGRRGELAREVLSAVA